MRSIGPVRGLRRYQLKRSEDSPTLSQRRKVLKRARALVQTAHKALHEAQKTMDSLGQDEVDRGVEWASQKALEAVADLRAGLKLLQDGDGT